MCRKNNLKKTINLNKLRKLELNNFRKLDYQEKLQESRRIPMKIKTLQDKSQ